MRRYEHAMEIISFVHPAIICPSIHHPSFVVRIITFRNIFSSFHSCIYHSCSPFHVEKQSRSFLFLIYFRLWGSQCHQFMNVSVKEWMQTWLKLIKTCYSNTVRCIYYLTWESAAWCIIITITAQILCFTIKVWWVCFEPLKAAEVLDT